MVLFRRKPGAPRTPEQAKAQHARRARLRRGAKGLLNKAHQVHSRTKHRIFCAVQYDNQFLVYCSDTGFRFWRPSLRKMVQESHPTPDVITPQSWPEPAEGVFESFGVEPESRPEEDTDVGETNAIDLNVSEQATQAINSRWAAEKKRKKSNAGPLPTIPVQSTQCSVSNTTAAISAAAASHDGGACQPGGAFPTAYPYDTRRLELVPPCDASGLFTPADGLGGL